MEERLHPKQNLGHYGVIQTYVRRKSISIDACPIAARFREVDVDISRGAFYKQLLYAALQIATIREISRDQHPQRIERAKRENPRAEQLRHFTRSGDSLAGVRPNIDGVGGLKRCIGALVLIIQQDDFLSDLRILQTDAARKAWLLRRDHLPRTMRKELFRG
jgi:hypothetical protein